MDTIKNILVAVDFSENDEKLLLSAGSLAQKFEAKVWVIHIAMPDPYFVGYEVGPQYIRDIRAKDLRSEHQVLQKYADSFSAAGIEAESLLVQGPTVETLLEEARKLCIDLFVAGVHKHGFLGKLFNENNPAELSLQAHIPVLIIP